MGEQSNPLSTTTLFVTRSIVSLIEKAFISFSVSWNTICSLQKQGNCNVMESAHVPKEVEMSIHTKLLWKAKLFTKLLHLLIHWPSLPSADQHFYRHHVCKVAGPFLTQEKKWLLKF